MTDKKLPAYLLALAPLLLAAMALTGCARNDSASGGTDTAGDQVSDQAVSSAPSSQTLQIEANRCTGCGKCARFDAEHFSFNPATGRAQVISQSNLATASLDMAIAACQTRAITLE